MTQGNYGGGFNPTNTPNPYAGNYGQAPPPKKSYAIFWILGIIGGVIVLGCGCCGVMSYVGFNTGMNMVAEQIKGEVQGHPAIQEHIGTIETATTDFSASMQETEKKGGQGNNHLVIHVKGSKGEGDIIGGQQPGRPGLSNKILRLPDGKEFPLE